MNLWNYLSIKILSFFRRECSRKNQRFRKYLCFSDDKSHRTTSEQELIRWDTAGAQVSGAVSRGHSTIPLELFLTKKGRKTKVNHIEQKLSSYIGQLNVILLPRRSFTC